MYRRRKLNESYKKVDEDKEKEKGATIADFDRIISKNHQEEEKKTCKTNSKRIQR